MRVTLRDIFVTSCNVFVTSHDVFVKSARLGPTKNYVQGGVRGLSKNEKRDMESIIGPCKGCPGILDSNFKRTADSGFKCQNGKILDSKFKLGIFRIQIFLYFRDSNFKPLFWDSFFKNAGIQDSNLKLMGFTI